MADAASRYWRWFGRLLAGWAQQRRQRRRRRPVIILVGPIVWLFLLLALMLYATFYVVVVGGMLVTLTVVGLFVSLASGAARIVNASRRAS